MAEQGDQFNWTSADWLMRWLFPAWALSDADRHVLRAMFCSVADITHECGTPEATRAAHMEAVLSAWHGLSHFIVAKGYTSEDVPAQPQQHSKPCNVCGGSGRVQHRGFSTACEHCAYRERERLKSALAQAMRVVAEGDKLRARWLDPEPAYDTERAKLKELG